MSVSSKPGMHASTSAGAVLTLMARRHLHALRRIDQRGDRVQEGHLHAQRVGVVQRAGVDGGDRLHRFGVRALNTDLGVDKLVDRLDRLLGLREGDLPGGWIGRRRIRGAAAAGAASHPRRRRDGARGALRFSGRTCWPVNAVHEDEVLHRLTEARVGERRLQLRQVHVVQIDKRIAVQVVVLLPAVDGEERRPAAVEGVAGHAAGAERLARVLRTLRLTSEP